jgi:hypothetical protein
MPQEKEKFYYTSKLLVFAGTKIHRSGKPHANCGRSRSDIHFWKRGRIGSLVVEGDCILGHEAAGVVLECGEGVTSLKPGSSSHRYLPQIT